MGQADDKGYATVAAVAAMLVFALLALEIAAASRGASATVSAQVQRARLTAAADAGLALAIHGLGAPSRAERWGIDGRPHRLAWEGADLTIVVEDERGKAPLNVLTEDQARQLFEAAGVTGERLDALVDAFEDWRDEDDEPRGLGAEAEAYRGYRPRNGPLRSVEELALIKGMDAATFARLKPAVTVFFGESGGFSPRTAHPIAVAAMAETGSVDQIEREREVAGQRTALGIAADESLVGRALTVRIDARDRAGGRLRRATIVEFTGDPARPYLIRSQE